MGPPTTGRRALPVRADRYDARMHDRRAGGPDGASVCPFLALATDRDARADVPDRRHRCYAEPEPAPRAIAHQQQYCLTPAFATCATFQDWARREAARVVPSTAGPAAGPAPVWEPPVDLDQVAGGGPVGRDQAAGDRPAVPAPAALDAAPGHEPGREGRDGDLHATRSAAGADTGRRSRVPGEAAEPGLWSDERAWAAPPPWRRGEDAEAEPGVPMEAAPPSRAGQAGDLGRGERSRASGRGPAQPEPPWGEAALRGAPLAPLPESAEGAVPSTVRRPFDEPWTPDVPAPGSPRAGTHGAGSGPGQPAPAASGQGRPDSAREPRDDVSPELPAFLARRASAAPDVHRDAAARLRPDAPAGAHPRRETGAGSPPAARPSPDLRPDGTPRPGRVVRPEPQARPVPTEDTGERGTSRLRLPGVTTLRRPRAEAGDGAEAHGAPSWERPLRREAYPDLRTRVGLPQIPRLWLGAIALLVAGIVLFLLPTLMPGFFGGQQAATPVPTATAAPTVSVAPTPPPLPTPFVYTVVQGDTLSGIAGRYGLTISQLLKANPQIKNENQLAIGDKITIPVKGSSGSSVTGAGAVAASGAPGGTSAP